MVQFSSVMFKTITIGPSGLIGRPWDLTGSPVTAAAAMAASCATAAPSAIPFILLLHLTFFDLAVYVMYTYLWYC
jgi:hypothetical protein